MQLRIVILFSREIRDNKLYSSPKLLGSALRRNSKDILRHLENRPLKYISRNNIT